MRNRPHPTATTLLSLSLVTLTALGAPAARAQPESVTRAEAHSTAITLREAVGTTLRNSFNLQLAEASAEQRDGAAQAATGMFDGVLFVDSEFSLRQQALLRSGIDSEVRRRVPAELAAVGSFDDPSRGLLDQAADAISGRLPTVGSLLFDDCASGQTRLILDAEGSTVTLCLNSSGVLQGIVLDGVDANGIVPGITPGSLPSGGGSFRVEDLDEILALLQILGALGDELLADIEEDLQSLTSDLLRNTASLLRAISSVFRLQQSRLGPLAEEEQTLDLMFEFGLRQPFRNGITLTTSFTLVGTEDNFVGKPLSPGFGGSQLPNTFTTSGGLRVLVPLGKGRGRIATAGPERAAQAAAEAEQRLYAHSASQEALDTVSVYWTLAAAQDRFHLLEESVARHEEILESTRELIDAEELPGAEIHRIEAQYREVSGQLADARQQLMEARLDLVSAMGQTAARLETTPLASDRLPTGRQLEPDADVWVERAFRLRNDLAAAAETVRSSDILVRSARANLRRQVDLAANVSYAGFHESFDQRIYDLSGYWDAVKGRGLPQPPGAEPLPQVSLSGPSYAVGFRFSLPVKNYAARGRLERARAARSQSQIEERDLKRAIRLQLHEQIDLLDRRRDELARLEEGVGYLSDSMAASLELYGAGDITLIDLLTTEGQMTDAKLAVVDALRDLAILESQILFESGQLLVAPSDVERFDPTQLELAETGAAGSSTAGP